MAEFKPHDYQQLAIREIESKPAVGLLLDMGLGKTAITLTAISNLLALDEVHKVLVIAPLATARNTWRDEVDKWDHLSGLRLSHILGSASDRKKAIETDADIYIINRENTQWLCDYIDEWPFDMLVIDELSSFKNPASKRFKSLKKIRPYISRVVGLTGTPASNGYMDLWSEVYLLDRGERLGKTVGMYRNTYFKPGRMNGYVVYEWRLRDGAKTVIDERLSDICVSMKAVDFLKMPDKIETDVFVSMDKSEKKLYDQLGKDRVLPDKDVIGATAATLQGKLLQMANGFVYDDEKNVHHIHSHKLEALSELYEASNERPLLVFYEFVADKDAILEHFPDAVNFDGSENTLKKWNRGDIRMLLAHPASAGHGLNLQEGGSIIVWYGLPWSLELYQQANARLYRQGQKDTVYIYHILTKDTHDVDVLASLKAKNITQEELLKALKARIKGWEK